MGLIILFVILSTISYLVIQSSVGKITQTPMFLLWLVLMTPPLIWTAWYLMNPNTDSMPMVLVVVPLILSPLVYLWLIEIGKPKIKNDSSEQTSQKTSVLLSKSDGDKSENSHDNEEQVNTQRDYNLELEEKLRKIKVRPINADEEKALKDCFPWGVYYLQKVDYLPQAILCLGKLMTAPEKAYPEIKANLEKVFNDRFLIIFQETLQGQPFFALVPNPYSKNSQAKQPPEQLTRPKMALGLMLLTFLTTTLIGCELAGVTVEQLEMNPYLIFDGLPYSLCLMAILGTHELGHYLFAIYYKVKTTLPYFIPIPFFLGTFGAFISMKSPMPHRKAVFDVGIAGPLAGFLVTVPVLVWGLAFSTVVPMEEDSATLLNFHALDPHFSFFFAVISKLALGSQLVAGDAIALHPAAVAGYIGLIVTALNLIPVGQLDGGHIVHAMFGQGKALVIGQITRIIVILFAFVRSEFLFWAILLLFMPIADQPALNDVTELDDKRDLLGLMALALLVVILLPVPGTVAQWLNI